MQPEIGILTCTRCGNQHGGKRRMCKPCKSIENAAWYAANSEKHKAKTAKWQSENPEKVRGYGAKWDAANAEKVRARSARYYAVNPDKAKAACAKWRAENPEKSKSANDAWRKANPEKVRTTTFAYRTANRERRLAQNKAWYKANPDAARIKNNVRRARIAGTGGKLSRDIAAKLERLQLGRCACGCKQPLGNDYHLDHIMPLALGGTNTDDNIQLLRAICNMQKSAKHPVEFMQQRGFLL